MVKFTLKSLLSHKARVIMTTFAVFLGVAFVSGAFVFADGMTRSFDSLFSQIYGGIDAQVRSEVAFGDATTNAAPVPESLLATVAAVPGVAAAEGSLTGAAHLIGADGEAIKPVGGAPSLGVNWTENDQLSTVDLVAGQPPANANQIALDKGTADRKDISVGDQLEVVVVTGRVPVTVSGIFKVGERSGFLGATVAAFETDAAQRYFNLPDQYNTIDVAAANGVSETELVERLSRVLPEGIEAVDNETLVEDNQEQLSSIISIFRNVLLGFAFVTLFVAAFLINNTFMIIIGQRIREFALLRALGASGGQITRLIIGESLVIATVATALGIVAGIGVSLLLFAMFNAFGAGFPKADIVLMWRTVAFAIAVGFVITLLAALLPALRARRVPPVAAMREGFVLHGGRVRWRIVAATASLVLGGALFAWAVFTTPGGGLETGALAGIGGVVAFIGVAGLSNLIARPVVRVLGKPLERFLRFPGLLATENAARNPRRTASTASALMIGLALVGGFLVLGESTKESVRKTLRTAVKADFLVSDPSFTGFTPQIAQDLDQLPELGAVSPLKFGQIQVDGGTKDVFAADPAVLPDLFDLDLQEGSIRDLGDDGILVHKDSAKSNDLAVGDRVEVTFPSAGTKTFTVRGVYGDATIAGNWLISLDAFTANFAAQNDFMVAARIADGVPAPQARQAVEAVTDRYPAVELQDKVEFNKSQTDQINQALLMINGLLVFALIVALFGIANTLALSVFERTREIGLLRAVGMTRRQTRRSVRWEGVLVAVFGAVIGIVVGVLFGVAITNAMPESFISVVKVPYIQMASLVIVAVVAGLLAALFPAWRASRMKVLDAIAYE